jgi:hypothetical protein
VRMMPVELFLEAGAGFECIAELSFHVSSAKVAAGKTGFG